MYNCHYDRSKQVGLWDDIGRTIIIISSVSASVIYGFVLPSSVTVPGQETLQRFAAVPGISKVGKAIVCVGLVTPGILAVLETGAKKAFHFQMGRRYQDLYNDVDRAWNRISPPDSEMSKTLSIPTP